MPKPRKPLEEDCTGGVAYPVEGHVVATQFLNGTTRMKHVFLTRGQWRTLHERRLAERYDRERA